MLRRHDQEQFLAQHRLPGEPVGEGVGRQPGDGDIDLIATQQREDLRRAAFPHPHPDAGVRVVEASQQSRQIQRTRRKHRAEHDGALLQPGERGQVGADRVRSGQDLAGASEHDGPGLGQHDAAAGSAQQREAELRLQLADGVGTADCARWSSSAPRVNVPACATWTKARS